MRSARSRKAVAEGSRPASLPVQISEFILGRKDTEPFGLMWVLVKLGAARSYVAAGEPSAVQGQPALIFYSAHFIVSGA